MGARLKGPPDINVAIKDGKHDDPGAGEFSVDGNHRVNATNIAKFKIQERNVRPMRAKLLDGLAAVGCLGHDQHVRLIVDNGRDPLAEKRVVVDTQHSYAGLIDHSVLSVQALTVVVSRYGFEVWDSFRSCMYGG